MNEERQRCLIAEACGWRHVLFKGTDGENGGEPWQEWLWVLYDGSGNVIKSGLRDYLHDLNAMHEAEKVIVEGQDKKLLSLWFIKMQQIGACAGTHATAAQRAEAFLRTIGKWEE